VQTDCCLFDINEERLKLAKKIGADHTVLVTRDTKEEEMVNKRHQLFGKEADITIECSGAPSSLRMSLFATKEGRTVLIVRIR
jgi:L-iditol 2-dehydrogenase